MIIAHGNDDVCGCQGDRLQHCYVLQICKCDGVANIVIMFANNSLCCIVQSHDSNN